MDHQQFKVVMQAYSSLLLKEKILNSLSNSVSKLPITQWNTKLVFSIKIAHEIAKLKTSYESFQFIQIPREENVKVDYLSKLASALQDCRTRNITGFAMTFYYRPTVTEAFAFVQYIMTEANFGWLIRSVHRWSASMMVLMMILHVFRVYLTGGFKKPRELTWVTGVVLAVLTTSFGVTGYSLPRDQIVYWAVKIVTGVPEAIPVIGSPLVELLRGSSSVGQSTLTRFIVY
ncbi:UNVERIFIED_CONTAM: cytochrome [Sesamum calycinum]|uniref:Cytochrome n=1 Tax=Sesamum calycinum TaxID=2727403 RepID=A0AAW2L6M7_9LAMI